MNTQSNPTIEEETLAELKKHTEYLNRIDWKLWVMMNMFESIARDQGYEFEVVNNKSSEPPIERVRVVDEGEHNV
jgi:hypothetical protein